MQYNAMLDANYVIWRLVDGKPGHDNQTAGLVKAINQRTACHVIDIPAVSKMTALGYLLMGQWPQGKTLPLPDLIIGAGQRTHLSMLAAQRAYGGKTVVLMQPSLPVSLFDLCLIPEHDNYQGHGDYITTRGVLNPIQVSDKHDKHRGLIMIGGPSKHFKWDEERLLMQIKGIVSLHPDVQFQLTTSRRTPKTLLPMLQSLASSQLMIVPFEQTSASWVSEQLSTAAMSWVTEDSASMVYEALTAQTAVGVMTMPARKDNRLTRGIRQLIQQQLIVRFDAEGEYKKTMKPAVGFMEADRCAHHLLTRWSDGAIVATTQLATHTS